MDSISPGLTAHKGSRGQILVELKHDQPLTAKELSDRLGVTATAIRRHLKELEAEGFVGYGREQRGQGAPTFAYCLTESGEALFPNQYAQTVQRLLAYLVQQQGRDAAVEAIEGQYEELKRKLGRDLDDMSPEERLAAVARVLDEAGFMPEVEEESGSRQLVVHNCAIKAVASYLPEVCEAELEFIKETLGADVERKGHIVNGCNACEYSVSFEGRSEEAPRQERA